MPCSASPGCTQGARWPGNWRASRTTCSTSEDGGQTRERLRVNPAQVKRLEAAIDTLSAELAPLTSFILPGGSPASAQLHLARCVVRRAELAVLKAAETGQLSEPLLVYLNRLSDYLFVAARQQNDGGKADVLWRPGG